MKPSLPDLIVWGGTGNFKVLCELLRDAYRIVGYFDNNPNIAPEYRGIPCLGNREAFLAWAREGFFTAETRGVFTAETQRRGETSRENNGEKTPRLRVSAVKKNVSAVKDKPHFIVSIGPGYGQVRRDVHAELLAHGLLPVTAIHRTAFVAENAVVGEGSQIYANATVCVDVQIGRNCIVNTNIMVVNTHPLPKACWRLSFYFFASDLVKAAVFFRMDSPFNSSRWAPLSKRSNRASATVGSFRYSCQAPIGSWLVSKVERKP